MPSPQDFLNALGNLAAGLQAAPAGVPRRVWQELWPWFSQLATNAAPKWVPRLGFGFACHVPIHVNGAPVGACPKPAIAACDVCGEPVCLAHARVDHFGDAICHLCIAQAMRWHKASHAAGAPPGQDRAAPGARPPPPQDVVWARRMLGVNKGSSWDEVRAAHRRKSGESHPDRAQGESAKKRAEERFKQIQRALDILQRERASKDV